jgi:pyridoxal/pyridoxine/pyridoxamine kinase
MVDRDPHSLPAGFGEACSAIARAIAESFTLEQVLERVAVAVRLIVAGDVRYNSPRGVAAAVADGATASRSVFEYLHGE